MPGKIFGHSESVKILVILNPTGYMLTSSGFPLIHFRSIPLILLKWWVILFKSRTSTGYFSNLTGSSVTNRRFSPNFVVLFNQIDL